MHYLDDYNRYYVLLKEEYSALDFSDLTYYYSYLGLHSVEYVGGQNKSLIVVCRESYLNRHAFRNIIALYAPIPFLGRIEPSVLTEISRAANEHSTILLNVQSDIEQSVKTLNISFSTLCTESDISES